MKIIDCLENYELIMKVIDGLDEFDRDLETGSFAEHKEEIMRKLTRRQFGDKMIRTGTPVEKILPGDVQSPSNNKNEIMILPGVTLQESEKNKMRPDGRDRKDVIAKVSSTGRTDGTSGTQKKVQNLIGRMNQPKKKMVDYLTPMREQREQIKRQAGKHEINWQEIVERAKMLRNVKSKQTVYLSHLGEEASVIC